MKRLMTAAVAASALLLAGCATTIRSDVTTFHQWPAQIDDKTYVFEAPPMQDDTLEWRAYQDLVRGQLARLGFRDADQGKPALSVSMRFVTTDVPVRVIEPMMSPFYHPMVHPLRYSYRGRYRGFHNPYWGGWYSPVHDPFWSPAYQVSVEHQYRRELQVGIKAADGKRLFDVTVHNTSRQMSTPAVMPALVQSAFEGFPGPSGVARRVELKQQNG
ncbi:DUF4136 domain-containing protein [Telluria aromaticivorans]|uniref:DUF4136 domain-containing protein n=1 Tax=Telluria aromaticivorans TaxID=2725995 RepID=A0A7Y2JZZ7_9BURK|nr:DUF4136 domain-containing protein [Telluria aromaticivorans]NNG22894.1 DUF4136 domain-containing protein [Telluria aromaticivorans]